MMIVCVFQFMYLMLPGRPELVGTYGVDLMTLFGCGCVDSGSPQDVADLAWLLWGDGSTRLLQVSCLGSESVKTLP